MSGNRIDKSHLNLEDKRDYDAEAKELIKPLTSPQCYELYGIVIKKQQKANTPVRDQELAAVRKAIESRKYLDKYRLLGIARGYKSEMARDARAKDGSTRPNNRKESGGFEQN